MNKFLSSLKELLEKYKRIQIYVSYMQIQKCCFCLKNIARVLFCFDTFIVTF